MQISILAIGRVKGGRAKSAPAQDLCAQYLERLSLPPLLREFEERRPLPPPERRAKEGALLLGALSPGALVVALDEKGALLSSEDFASKLGQWRDSGVRELAFLIGGADGLDEAVKARADFTLSLGPLTWPHLLVRALLAEQLFRAESINAGHPYHRSG